MSTFVTVAEAADFAGVTPRSIYYHISKSRKLYPITVNGVLMILEDELRTLYPARQAGRKQFLKDQPETRESLIIQITNMITANAIAGDFHTVQSLATKLRYI